MATPSPKRSPLGGGFLLALSIFAGVIGGGLLGQPSIGLIAGVAVGVLLLGFVWLLDRRRL
jgi:hypothetical protein